MSIFQDAILRFGRTIMSYAGDAVFLQAAVSSAANVIVADGDVGEEEIESAISGIRANPILEKSYDTLRVEQELYEAIARAKTRAGRLENLRRTWPISTASARSSTGRSTRSPGRCRSTSPPCCADPAASGTVRADPSPAPRPHSEVPERGGGRDGTRLRGPLTRAPLGAGATRYDGPRSQPCGDAARPLPIRT